jgi:exodeoxyribonuclease V alpha subunit
MSTLRKLATAQNSNIGEEVSAVFVRERFRFQNSDGDVVIATAWRNGEASDPISIKGPAECDELTAGQTYRFFGKWTSYKNKRTGDTEAQLAFTSFVVEQPADREGIIAYLKSAGDGFGIGQSRAVKLWDLYGSDAVRICREEPERVIRSLAAEGLRVKESSFHAFVAGLIRMQKTEAATIDCNAILANTGCRKTLTRSLLRDYGNFAALRLRRNPFLITDYTGHGFELADKLWKRLKLPMHKLRRQAYAALWTVKKDNQNTWLPRSHVEKEVAKLIGSKARPTKAVELSIRAGLLVEERTDGVSGPIAKGGNIRWLALPQDHHNERKIAEYLAAAAMEKHDWPSVGEIENVDGEQPQALAACLTGMVAILGGRPGTGKTFCAANLIKACVKKFGERQIGIGAPTNLAAMRLNQVMSGYGVAVKARTNHSLLGFPDRIGEDWRHNERNKWPCKVMIFDESSMKDASIFRAILAARPRGCMILFVGDHNQLPPVQSGKPFFDCIRAGLPYYELTKIRRNDGGIVEACKNIAENKPWGPGGNLELIQTDSEEQQQAAIERTLIEIDRIGLCPIWDSRIIVARNVRRRSLNKWLQGLLNPANPVISGSPFRVCDKVICRETSEFKVIGGGNSATVGDDFDDSGDRSDGKMVKVPNGELGKVVSVNERSMVVELLVSKSLVLVPRFPVDSTTKVADDDDKSETDEADKTGTGCAWELAYAVTFHSSQGSEFPWPIMVATSADAALGSRELVYTGISRGKNRCTLIGLKSTWDKFCRNVSLLKRKTLLTERILIERAKLQLGEM